MSDITRQSISFKGKMRLVLCKPHMKKAECWLPDPCTKLLGMYTSLVRVDSPVTSEDSENDNEVLV